MDGIHDLGGMQGFGPVPVKAGDTDFADSAEWEKRMWGLSRNSLVSGITIDWFRHGLERMVPADYLSFAYFNKWCANFLMLMLDDGVISMDDVKRGHVAEPAPPAKPVSVDDALAITARADVSFEMEALSGQAFGVGDAVETCRIAPGDHTRLPRYARGARGTVVAHHGAHAMPDQGVRGNKLAEHLYTVAFKAPELWGEDADPRDDVTLDLWESYLVRA